MDQNITRKGPAVIRSANSNTLSDNYRDSLAIAYQFIGSVIPKIQFSFCGREFTTPVMVGPVGGFNKFPDGCLRAARATNEAGSLFWSDYHDPEAWKNILAEGIPAIRVIKPIKDNDRLIQEIRYDTEHGALGYAVDFDHGITPYGEFDEQRGVPFGPKSIDDLKKLNEASELPFFLKGVMSVHDALMAREAGVAGIIISNHNNRFPCTVPPLRLLPEVRKAVGDDLIILIDGGLNTGYEAFKALALGADGILFARDAAAAFVKGQDEGLKGKILQMTAELKGAMANTGSPDLQHINHECVIKL